MSRHGNASATLVQRLNSEWQQLQLAAPDWVTAYGPSLETVRRAIAGQPDLVLAELIAAGQAGSQLASRVVVQAFLGHVVRLAQRDRRLTPDLAVAALWLRVATYPLARRPQRIAANLVCDLRKDLVAEHKPLGCGPVAPPPSTDAETVFNLAADWALVSPQHLAVAASVYRDGLTSQTAAERHQLSATTVRWRCHQAISQLRRHRDLLADYSQPSHPEYWVAVQPCES
ncbi:MAG: hypothetical protein LBL92_05425 [Propionibacteriaceae bacterium]|jgi:DNA-directed RNA polymerase specialized sigma24 family protein|nr:hypothetical protein [Propionibacteriaceae bacterium]